MKPVFLGIAPLVGLAALTLSSNTLASSDTSIEKITAPMMSYATHRSDIDPLANLAYQVLASRDDHHDDDEDDHHDDDHHEEG